MIDKDSDTDRKKIREDTTINSSDSKNYKKISSSLKHRGELTFIYSLIPQNENLR